MGLRNGLAAMMDFVGQYAGTHDLLKQKAKTQSEANEAEEMQRLMRGPREYNLWTNPDDPIRKLLAAKYPGMAMMKGVTPQQFMKLKNPGLGGGGGIRFAPTSGGEEY